MADEKLEMINLDPGAKAIRDEAAVRLASLVYVWDGSKGVFFEPDTFVALKKRFPCTSQTIEGVEVAALTEHVKEPNWVEIHKSRMAEGDGMRAFYEKVALFRQHDKGLAKAMLVTYYERGKFVDELSKAPAKYGNQSVKKFAAEMKVSESTAYLYQRFAALYQEKRVLELTSKEMAWSSVVSLLSLKVDKERAKIEDQYIVGKLDEKTLAVAVKKAKRAEAERRETSGEKVDRRGGPGLSRLFDSMKAMSDKLQEKLAEYSEGRKAWTKLPDDKRKQELKAHLKAADGSLMGVYKKLSKMVEVDEKP